MLLRRSIHSAPGTSALPECLDRISPALMHHWVEHIAVPRHAVANAKANAEVASWIAQRFLEWGYDVTIEGHYRNIIAVPPGLSGDAHFIGAHYDSVPTTPGADDNGSAVAVMLACAHASSVLLPDLRVGFAAFNCEEDGLLGSTEWVRDYLPHAPYQVRQMHVLEMVGYTSSAPGSQRVPPGLPVSLPERGDFIGILGNRDSAALMQSALAQVRQHCAPRLALGIEVLLGLEKWFPVLQRSDHAPFWQVGIPALMWTDTSEFRNPHYHRASDTPDTLDYAFMTDVARAVLATVLASASSSER